jgi:uncharacterized protein
MTDDLFDIAGSSDDPDAVPDLVLRLHVHPGAGRTAVVGRHGDALKVKVGAPPADGRANAACLALVADTVGIPVTQVELTSGGSSRAKRVRIKGVVAEDLRRAIELAVGNAVAAPGVRPSAH